MMRPKLSVSLLLRIALAFSLAYPAITALFNPEIWIGYFPAIVLDLPASPGVLLHTFGVLELGLAVWLLSGRYVYYPAGATAVLLLAIVLFNWNQVDVLFRDLSLALAAVALAVQSWQSQIQHLPRKQESNTQM